MRRLRGAPAIPTRLLCVRSGCTPCSTAARKSAGIVAYDGEQFSAHRGPGLVSDNFSSKEVIARLQGMTAIGHVRYATTGEVALRNIQPLFADFDFGGLAICHNGNLTNSYQLRRQLVRRGSLFQSTSDTEVIVHLIATSLKGTVVERLTDAVESGRGGVFDRRAVAGVDDRAARPVGSAAAGARAGSAKRGSSLRKPARLDIIGADFVRDVEPGEIVIVGAGGVRSVKPFAQEPRRLCVFEYIYFARPDSDDGRQERLRGAEADRPRAGPEIAGRGRYRRAGARFGRPGGAWLCRRIPATVRARDHPQPLCRTHLHRADRPGFAISASGSSTTPTAPTSKASG